MSVVTGALLAEFESEVAVVSEAVDTELLVLRDALKEEMEKITQFFEMHDLPLE